MGQRHPVCGIPLLLFMVLCWCTEALAQKEYLFTGRTMGTTYQVKVVSETMPQTARIQSQINERLEQINASMSTFRPRSEISRFNALQAKHQPFIVSEDFINVMMVGRRVFELTQGAWDGTITPLVTLWGFGNAAPIQQPPHADAIAMAMKKVGFGTIGIVPDKGVLEKRRQGVTLDLASIAKGYGVDEVARLMHALGFHRLLVEIGGEVYASGRRLDGQPWRVGINQPQKGGAFDAVYKVVPLENRAMATSGDYRNFVKIDERYYSHIIDPRTGYPVSNRVVSVSVIAGNCTLADGLATALMVMGPKNGIDLLNALPDVEGLIVVRLSNGSLRNYWSNGMVDAQ